MRLFVFILMAGISCHALLNAQCHAPEIVGGADKYNALICRGVNAEARGNEHEALENYLAASNMILLETPNVLLFGRIAKTYARLGQFKEADVYLEYDNLRLLWLIGVVRCQAQPSFDNEVLLQDGKLLQSAEATHMQSVMCGEILDNDAYFAERNAISFIPVAKAILRHGELRKEIDLMRSKSQVKK
jgi:hypothetical protein